MIWTLLTVLASICGIGFVLYYVICPHMKLLERSELAILLNSKKKKDEDRWIPASEAGIDEDGEWVPVSVPLPEILEDADMLLVAEPDTEQEDEALWM